MITCPKCGQQNRLTAKFCQHCGADPSPTRAMPSAVPDRGKPAGLLQKVKRWVMGVETPPAPPRPAPSPASTRPLPVEAPATPQPVAQPRPASPAAPQTDTRVMPPQRGSILSHPQNPRRR